MKIRPLIVISTVCIATFFTACKHADKSGILAPKDVTFLVHIDGASLASKLSWDDVKATSWFKEAYSKADDSLQKKLMDNPENSGIDIRSNFAVFMKKVGSASYIAVEGSLRDSTAFLAFNKKINKGDASITRDGDVSHMVMSHGASSLTWNETHFIYLVSTPSFGLASYFKGPSSEMTSISTDSLSKYGKDILDISNDNNIASDDRFSKMIGEAGDMHMWTNYEEYFNSFAGGVLSMMKLDAMFNGSISTSTASFENGKITVKGKQYYNKEMSRLLEKYPAHSIGADIINRIPSKNVAGVIVFNYPPAGLQELLKLIGVDGIVNSGLGKINYSIDDFVKANKGDMVIAVSDLQTKTREFGGGSDTFKTTTPDAKVLFATSINDKPSFDKLVTSLKGLTEQYAPGGIPDVSYSSNNNWFAAGNSQDDVNIFLSGNGSTQPFTDKISGHTFGCYVDLQKLMSMGNDATSDSSAKATLDASLKMWQDVVGYGDASTGSYFEVNLVDKNTNSLKQLNQYIDKMAALVKERIKGNEDVQIQMDSIPRVVDSTMVMPKH